MELKDATKQIEYQRDQQGLRLRRRAFQSLKLEKMLQEVREEKMYYRRREKTVKENAIKSEAEIARKRRDIREIQARIRNRQDNSPTVYNYLVGLKESLRDDIHVLESKKDMYAEQRGRLMQQQDQAQKEIGRLQAEVDNTQKQHETATEKLTKEEGNLNLIREEIERLEAKVEALKRIREIKLHSDTVKKIYHYGYNPGQMRNNRGEPLQQSCL
jgi:chromosome segregation ATPase